MNKNKVLPLRLGVGAIVLNNKNRVFVGKRKDNPVNKWQMPQGGDNEGEKLIDAMKRELKEELSIKININKLIFLFSYQVQRRREIINLNFFSLDSWYVFSSGNSFIK